MKKILLVCLLVSPPLLWAGEYFLIDQKVVDPWDKDIPELCSRLVENFNRYKSEPPMVCVRKFDTEFLGVSFPEWELVDVDSAVGDIRRIYEESSNDHFDALYQQWKDNRAKIWKSEFDINSDGSTNIVYRITSTKYEHSCKDRSGNKGIHEGAVWNRYRVEQNQKNEFQSGFRNINTSVMGNIFVFRDRTYFHTWEEGSYLKTEKSKAFVYPFPRILIRQGGQMVGFEESFFADPVCEIGYRQ
ncbi:MAG: hypothetical protein GY820_00835 [Gammaproteobacteria bacterium]|nr:hypothetical protein [Gammaproteobacteria bacterium]